MAIAPIDVQVNTVGQMETSQWVGTENKSTQQLAATAKEIFKEKEHDAETKVAENEKTKGKVIDKDGKGNQDNFNKNKKRNKNRSKDDTEDTNFQTKDQRIGRLIDVVR